MGDRIYYKHAPGVEFDKLKVDLFDSWHEVISADPARLQELTDGYVDLFYRAQRLELHGNGPEDVKREGEI